MKEINVVTLGNVKISLTAATELHVLSFIYKHVWIWILKFKLHLFSDIGFVLNPKVWIR